MHQDRPCPVVEREPVEQVRHVDIGALAERGDGGKADAVGLRPGQGGVHHRAGAGDEGKVARAGLAHAQMRGKPRRRRGDAEAAGAEQAQRVGTRRLQRRGHGRIVPAVVARRQGGDGARARPAERGDGGRRLLGGAEIERKVGRLVEIGEGSHGPCRRRVRLTGTGNGEDLPAKAGAGDARQQQVGDLGAEPVGPDHGERGGAEERIEIADRHRHSSCLSGASVRVGEWGARPGKSKAPPLPRCGGASLPGERPGPPPGRSLVCDRRRQCAISTGTVIEARMSRVAPPNRNSRMREWP